MILSPQRSTAPQHIANRSVPQISPQTLRTDAWLLRGIHSLPGALQLAGRRLSFTAFNAGTLRRRQLRALEHEVGTEGLAAKLSNGESALVFDVPISTVQDVHFPWYYFNGGCKLTLDGVRYRIGFDQPSNTKGTGEGGDLFGSIARARRHGKMWKAVFAELGDSPTD